MDKSSFSVVKKLVPPPSNTDTFTTSLDDEERTVCYTYPTETGDDSQFIKSPIREEFDFSYFCYTSDEEDSSSQQSDLGGNSHIHEGDNVLKTSRVNNVRVEHEQSCHVSNNRKITKEIIYIDSDESDDDDDDDDDDDEKLSENNKLTSIHNNTNKHFPSTHPLKNRNKDGDPDHESFISKQCILSKNRKVSISNANTTNRPKSTTKRNIYTDLDLSSDYDSVERKQLFNKERNKSKLLDTNQSTSRRNCFDLDISSDNNINHVSRRKVSNTPSTGTAVKTLDTCTARARGINKNSFKDINLSFSNCNHKIYLSSDIDRVSSTNTTKDPNNRNKDKETRVTRLLKYADLDISDGDDSSSDDDTVDLTSPYNTGIHSENNVVTESIKKSKILNTGQGSNRNIYADLDILDDKTIDVDCNKNTKLSKIESIDKSIESVAAKEVTNSNILDFDISSDDDRSVDLVNQNDCNNAAAYQGINRYNNEKETNERQTTIRKNTRRQKRKRSSDHISKDIIDLCDSDENEGIGNEVSFSSTLQRRRKRQRRNRRRTKSIPMNLSSNEVIEID